MADEKQGSHDVEEVEVQVAGESQLRKIPIRKVPSQQWFRDHKADEMEELAGSIKREGQKVPIDITSEGVILAGHKRYVICKAQKKIPFVRLVDHLTTDVEKQDYILAEGMTGSTWRHMSEIDKGKVLYDMMIAQGVRKPTGESRRRGKDSSEEVKGQITEREWLENHHISSSGFRWVKKYLVSIMTPAEKDAAQKAREDRKAEKDKDAVDTALIQENQRVNAMKRFETVLKERDDLVKEVHRMQEELQAERKKVSTPAVVSAPLDEQPIPVTPPVAPVPVGTMSAKEIQDEYRREVMQKFGEIYPGFVLQLGAFTVKAVTQPLTEMGRRAA